MDIDDSTDVNLESNKKCDVYGAVPLIKLYEILLGFNGTETEESNVESVISIIKNVSSFEPNFADNFEEKKLIYSEGINLDISL